MKEEEEAPGKKRREKKSVHPELSRRTSQVKEQSGVRLDDLNIYVKDIVLYRFGLCVN